MLDKRLRDEVERGLRPVGSGLARSGLSPDLLTLAGLIFAAATGVVIAVGELRWGLALLVLSSVPDMLDGAVAKASGRASARGAFFDSVADRLSDALVLGGVAWHLSLTSTGHAPMLAFAVVVVSMLVSYERARAESLGLSGKGGLMERAERIILLGLGLAVPAFLIPILWAMLILTSITAIQRFVMVWNQASARVPREKGMTWRQLRDRAAARQHSSRRSPLRERPNWSWQRHDAD